MHTGTSHAHTCAHTNKCIIKILTIVGIINIMYILPAVAFDHISDGAGMWRTHVQVITVNITGGLMFHVVSYVRHVESPRKGVDDVKRSGIDTTHYHKHAIGHVVTD